MNTDFSWCDRILCEVINIILRGDACDTLYRQKYTADTSAALLTLIKALLMNIYLDMITVFQRRNPTQL
jgi:hypothetical protein